MKLFRSLFKIPDTANAEENPGIPWFNLTSAPDLDQLETGRAFRPQVLFKHSTSCGLSGMMLRRFEKLWGSVGDQADFYFLDLIAHRELSNAVSRRYGVPHQSPQLIIIGAEGVLLHSSHGEIGAISPEEVLKNPA